jgi:acetyltransferase-like isoleucine patch superfamily enzyme
MEDSWRIQARSSEFRDFLAQVKVATRLSAKFGTYNFEDTDAIQRAFEELTGKQVGDSFYLIPPFYADYGLNISVGRSVHIGYDCMFTGHAAIDIADEVMIAPRVSLVTAAHPVDPGERRAYITAKPITIEQNVWIGTGAMVLGGVRIGAGSVVGAGAVVTRDIPARTVVAGNPAKVIRHL